MGKIGRQQIQIFIICAFNAPLNGFAAFDKAFGLSLQFGLVKLGGLIYAFNSYMSYNQNEYYHP